MAVVVASIPTFSIEEEDNLDAFIDRLIGYYNAIGVNPNGAGGGPPIGRDRAMGILRGCLKGSVADWFDEQIVGKNWKLKYFLSAGGAGNIGVLQALAVVQGGAGLHANSFVAGSPADVFSRDPANGAVTIQASMVPSFDMLGGDTEWERIGAEPSRDPVNAPGANNNQPIVLPGIWPHQALSWMRRKLPSILEEKRKLQLHKLLQGDDPIRVYWKRVERAGKLLKLPQEVIDDYFFKGLSPDNLDETDRMNPELPVSKVITILEKLEKRRALSRLGLSRRGMQKILDAEPKQVPPVAQQEPVEIRRVAPQAIAQEHIDKLLNEQADKIARGFQEQIQAFQAQFQDLQDKISQQSRPAPKPSRKYVEDYEGDNPFDGDYGRTWSFEEIMGKDYKQPPKPNKALKEFAIYSRAMAKARRAKYNQKVDKLADKLADMDLNDDYDPMDINIIDGSVILEDENGNEYTVHATRSVKKK